MPLFDTHAHYNDDAFDQNRKGLLDALPDAGVGAVVIPGVDVESSRSALALAESRPWLFAAAGIHPEDCAGCTAADFSAIRDLCREKKVVAIGEIGLDYYWAENPPKEFQQMVFRRQLELALELELPVIVHDREAHGDSLEIVKEFPGVRGVFHCFSGSPEMAEELLKRGWYLGFDGPVTYKNARRAPGGRGRHAPGPDRGGDGRALHEPGAQPGQAERQPESPLHCGKTGGVEGHLPGGDGGAHLEQWPAAVRAGGEGMKKAFLMVLACLLLAGCGAPTGTTAKVPETAPEEPISAPAVVTEGRVPEEYDALPTEVVSLYDWQTSGEPLALLAEIPEQEMALYGVADRDAPHVLFRWGDTLAEFPDWVIYTPKSVTPELLALDLDGDGAVEPVVSCFQGGNQVSRYALHVLQQSRGTLTDSQLPDSLYEEQLSALLTLSGSGEMLTISLGSQSIEAALRRGCRRRLWNTCGPELLSLGRKMGASFGWRIGPRCTPRIPPSPP